MKLLQPVGNIRNLALAAATAITITVTGCAEQPKQLPPMQPGSVQPFDLFLRDDFNSIDEALKALFHRCLSDAGFPQAKSLWSPGSHPSIGELGASVVQPRTVEQARKYGFGKPIPAQPAKLVWTDAAYLAAVDSCEVSSKSELGDPQRIQDLRQQYADLSNNLMNDYRARARSVLGDYGDALTRCLTGKGYSISKGARFDPNQAVKQFGIVVGRHADEQPATTPRPNGLPASAKFHPGTLQIEYVPTPQETDFAVVFVQCGEETRFFAELDRKALTDQQEIVEDHAAEFAELNPQIQELARAAAKVVS